MTNALPMFNADTLPIFDLDATQSASYSGSGTTWHNLITNPADGSAQAAYDFTIHGSPTFTGGAGTSGAYFAMSGTNYFEIAGGNTTFLNQLAQNFSDVNYSINAKQPWTMVFAFRTDAGPTNASLFGTEGGVSGTTTYGISGKINTESIPNLAPISQNIGLFQYDNLVGAAGGVRGNFVPLASTDYLVAMSFGGAWTTGQFICVAVNNRSLNSSPSAVHDVELDPTTATPSAVFRFASAGDGTPVASGTRVYGCYLFGSILTDAQYSAFVDVLNARQGNRWSF